MSSKRLNQYSITFRRADNQAEFTIGWKDRNKEVAKIKAQRQYEGTTGMALTLVDIQTSQGKGVNR